MLVEIIQDIVTNFIDTIYKVFVVTHISGLGIVKRGSRSGYRNKHKKDLNNTEKFLRPLNNERL